MLHVLLLLLCLMQEIIVCKEEGEAKIQNLVALGEILMSMEGTKETAIQQTISELQNQWECTLHLATKYLRYWGTYKETNTAA